MKNFIHHLSWIFVFTLYSINLFGQGDKIGNGGGALVCRDQNQKITFAQLYDIWENKVTYPAAIDKTKTLNAVYEIVDSINPYFAEDFKKELQLTIAKITESLQQEPHSLSIVGDFHRIHIPSHCPAGKKGIPRYEQVIEYSPEGVLSINSEVYDALDSFSQMSLWVHESIYRIFRFRLFHQNSQSARTATARLMSVAVGNLERREVLYSEFEKHLSAAPPKELIDRRRWVCRDYEQLTKRRVEFSGEDSIPGEYELEILRQCHHLRSQIKRINQYRYVFESYFSLPYYQISKEVIEAYSGNSSKEAITRLMREYQVKLEKLSDITFQLYGKEISPNHQDAYIHLLYIFEEEVTRYILEYNNYTDYDPYYARVTNYNVTHLTRDEKDWRLQIRPKMIRAFLETFQTVLDPGKVTFSAYDNRIVPQFTHGVDSMTILMFAALVDDAVWVRSLLNNPNVKNTFATTRYNNYSALDFAQSDTVRDLLKAKGLKRQCNKCWPLSREDIIGHIK